MRPAELAMRPAELASKNILRHLMHLTLDYGKTARGWGEQLPLVTGVLVGIFC